MLGCPPKGGLTDCSSISVEMTERLLTPFNSIGVLMLAGLFAQAGHSQTLPEQLTAETVMSFVEANNIETVADLIASLPPLHKVHVSLVFDSRALNKELVSREHPRIVSWGADARFVLSWASNPEAPDNIEFLQPLADRWDAGVIDFSGEEPELSRPAVCATCHGPMERPIWGDYNEWRGTNDDKKLEQSEWVQILSDLRASNNPRISPLDLRERRLWLQTVSSSETGDEGFIVQLASEFGSMLSLRHAEVLFNRLQKRDNFAELAEKAVCGDFTRVTSQFPLEDHYIAAMHDGDQLIVVQEDSDSADHLHDQSFFHSGNANVENSLKFLVLHDIWSQDSRVSDYYSMLGNETVSPRFRSYLNHVPGTATAEDELRASYDQHFALTGQASLDARIDAPVRRGGPIHKTAVFHEGHFRSMASNVCNILRKAPNQRLSQLRIADGRAGEAAGEIAFSVTLDPVRSEPVSVNWLTSLGVPLNTPGAVGADSGIDYADRFSKLTFNAGEARKNITVEVMDDDVAEPAEYFRVVLDRAPANTLILDGVAWGTIESELPPLETKVLTVGFENAPALHDAATAFTVQLRFSEEVWLSGGAFREGLLAVAGGTVGQAVRVAAGSNTAWEVTVTPDGESDVVITLPANQACDANMAACTVDGRSLAESATVTIPWSALPPTSAAPSTPVTPPQDDVSGEDSGTETVPTVDDAEGESAGSGAGDGSGSATTTPPVDDGSGSGSVSPPVVAAAWGERLSGKDIELPSGSDPTGLWSDGTTLWVISNWSAGEVTTYSLADGTSASHRFHLQGDGYPAGLWSDGETLWVADLASKVSAYRLSDGARQEDHDVPQTVLAAAGNTSPTGVWSDGETLWVADNQAWKVFAYRMSDKVRVSDKEFDLLSADSRLLSPWGLWSDGETALVTLYSDGGVKGYALSGGALVADRALDAAVTGQLPMGLWSDGETLWVLNQGDPRIRAYAVPGLRAAASEDASSMADPFSVRVVTRVDAAPGGVGAGPPVFMADAALHGAVAGALGLGPDEPVGLDALARIRSLNVRSAGIADLTGLEYAVNLQSLDLGQNPVRDPWMLGLLPRLTVLNLDGAATDLSSLATLVALERLSLRDNGLTDISALAGLVNLRHLSLRGNALSQVWPLAGLAQLEILDLRGNTVRDRAPLSGLYNMRHLDISDNARVRPHKDAVTK